MNSWLGYYWIGWLIFIYLLLLAWEMFGWANLDQIMDSLFGEEDE